MASPASEAPGPPLGVVAVRIGLLAVGLVGLLAWWLTVFQASSADYWQRDWYCIWDTGRSVLEGRRAGLYTTDFSDAKGYFWLYPPYALLPAAAFALLPQGLAYGALTVLILAAFAASATALAQQSPLGRDDAVTMALVFAGSASLNSVVVTGQNSAWWLAFLVAGMVALQRDRPGLAAACFAVWGFKPNWVACLVLWLIVTRRWRVLGFVATGGVVLVASSLPLGGSLWSEFATSSRGLTTLIFETYEVYKLISLHATLRSLVPAVWVGPLWVIGELFLLGSVGRIWWGSRDVPRQVGALALFVLVGNVYANFYDSLLLLVPAMVWWGRRDRYPVVYNLVIGGSLAATWAWLWVSLYGAAVDPPALVGGFLAVWLIAEALATPYLEPTEPA